MKKICNFSLVKSKLSKGKQDKTALFSRFFTTKYFSIFSREIKTVSSQKVQNRFTFTNFSSISSTSISGMSQDDAKTKYMEYANEMVGKHGTSS